MQEHRPIEDLLEDIKIAESLVEVGGFYYHYKNPDKAYFVTLVAIVESSEEPCVIYRPTGEDKVSFVRPISEWFETVEFEGRTTTRFTKIEGSV